MTAFLDDLKIEVRQHGGHFVEQNMDVDILSRGLLVRVSVYGTGVFDRSLRFEELGISSQDTELAEHIRPGIKSYAPEYGARLASWGVLCRQAATRYCIHMESVDAITASQSWRFMYFDAYDDFKRRWNQLQEIRDTILNDIESNYDNLLEQAVTFYVTKLGESWDTLQRRYRIGGGVAVRIPKEGLLFHPDDREAYIDWVEQNVRSDFPSLTKIRESVYAEYAVNIMFDSAKLAEAAARENAAYTASRAERLRQIEIADQEWEITTSRDARETAIRATEMERMRMSLAQTIDPYAEAMNAMLSELSMHIRAMLDGLEKNGGFRGRASDRISALVETYRLLGGRHLGDQDMERLINELQAHKQSEPTAEQRGTWQQSITDGLQELKERVRSQTDIIERRVQAQTRAGALEL